MKKRVPLRKALIGVAVFFPLYVGSYIPLSIKGGWVVSESGKTRITLAMADILEWQPRYGSFHRMRSYGGGSQVRADLLGWLYSPLILADQRWFHPTIPFIEEGFRAVEPLPAPPIEDYHPTRANRFHGRFPYEPVEHQTRRSVNKERLSRSHMLDSCCPFGGLPKISFA